jgi:cytochrome c oxidase subunit 1
MLPAFWVQSLGQMYTGLMGMRRRIADYDPALGLDFTQLLITIAGVVIMFSVLIAFINFAYSLRRGAVAAANPWRSRSPEYQLPSPLLAQNFPAPVHVVGEPYDYGLPGSVYVTTEPVKEEPEPAKPERPAAAPAAAD